MKRFDVQILHSITETDQEHWDQLGKGQPFTSHRWYQLGEKVLTGNPPLFIILYHEGQPIARATFWLMSRESLPIPPGIIHNALLAILRHRPLMVCRSPLAGNTSGLILPEPPLRKEALGTITQVAQELARQHKASFILFDYLNNSQAKWAGWPQSLAHTTLPDPGTALPITWPDFDSYLKQLPNSVRKDYRRHRNRAADQGIEITHHKHITQQDEALKLIRNVEQHHNTPPNPWTLPVLKHGTTADALWQTAHINGRLVGCGLILGDHDARCLTLLGLDYDTQYVYFQLVYHAIQRTIEDGYKMLLGGGGAYQIKTRLGYQIQDNNHVRFSTNNRLFRQLVNRAITTLSHT